MKSSNYFIIGIIGLCFSFSAQAEEIYLTAPDDPLIFIGSDRLEAIIRALQTKEKVELLLGSGVGVADDKTLRRYLVAETNFREGRFVTVVSVRYGPEMQVLEVHFPAKTPNWVFSPKPLAGHLAAQIPSKPEDLGLILSGASDGNSSEQSNGKQDK